MLTVIAASVLQIVIILSILFVVSANILGIYVIYQIYQAIKLDLIDIEIRQSDFQRKKN